MKKLKYLLLIMAISVILPLGVSAKEKINIYFFRGEGCPHCQEAEEFFDSIEDSYGKYYNIVDYEVWKNQENANLMEEVADKLGEEVSGVPYIIIGKKTWNGYDSQLNSEIKKAIRDEYNKSKSERYDVLKEENTNNVGRDIIIVVVIILVCGGIVFSIIMTRKTT